jgi:hypothetical protein
MRQETGGDLVNVKLEIVQVDVQVQVHVPWTLSQSKQHLLEVDPRLLRIEAVRALDDGVGRETVSSMAQRKGALAAVNAGFFRIGGRYDGEPDGILKIQQHWFSDPAELRGAIGWSRGGETAGIGRLKMKWKLQAGGSTFLIDGINRPRGASEAILYNWAFHRSTLTDPDGIEFLVSGNMELASNGLHRGGHACFVSRPAPGL